MPSAPATGSSRQTRTNRAVVCLGDGATQFEAITTPIPEAGEVLVRLECCGLCGTDLFKLATGGDPPGRVLGHEVVGTVVELGTGVSNFEAGDRLVTPHHVPCRNCHLCKGGNETLCATFREDLIAPGGLSEHFVVRARAVERAARKIPLEISNETAVFLEPAACVLRGIDRAGLLAHDPDHTADLLILVIGAGSMGLLHLLVLKSLFPEAQIVVTDPIPERRETALRLGAKAAVDPTQVALEIGRLETAGGVDTVFDTVGNPAAIEQAIGLTREGGSVALFAHAPPGERLPIDLNSLFKSERRLVGTYSGGPREQSQIWDLLSGGSLDPSSIVTHRLPLSQFDQAVELTRSHMALKVLLYPEGNDGLT